MQRVLRRTAAELLADVHVVLIGVQGRIRRDRGSKGPQLGLTGVEGYSRRYSLSAFHKV